MTGFTLIVLTVGVLAAVWLAYREGHDAGYSRGRIDGWAASQDFERRGQR